MPPATHNVPRTEIHPYTATQQNCVTCTGLSKPHAHLQVRLVHTPHTHRCFYVQPILQAAPCREHSHSLTSGDQSRPVCNTSTFDIIRYNALLFKSSNKPHSRVSLYFHSRLCQPAPTAAAHPHRDCMVSCQFFVPISLGNKARQTHVELSSFMTLKIFAPF